jgi:anti-anti-sigma factor
VVVLTSVNLLRMELLSDTPDTRSTTVRVAGQIDVSSVGALQDVLELACEPDQQVIVDMEGVTFMDSSGINALLGVVERTGIQHRGLVVQNPSPNVEKIISILGLAETLGLKWSATNSG